jgi:membrane-bound lytic murein transglycosylase D
LFPEMRLLAPALIFCGAIAGFGQSPQVPHKMQFAGMTLTIRDDARREIQTDVDALTRSPKYFNIKAERARTYFPIIEEVFSQERLPLDFKYLALQESALVPDAVSSSNAVGFWQFKDFTALEMGLRVDNDVDERMNIASASKAAARYLKQCNHYFNNWVYALQSYQMGAGGVMRTVGDKDLGSRHMEVTTDTYWYVKKFLAHMVAFEGVGGEASLNVTVVRDAGGKTLAQLAGEYSLDELQLQEFNKWLRTNRIPEDKEYVVLVPKGTSTPGFGVLTVAKPVSMDQKDLNQKKSVPEFTEINGIRAIRALPGESLAALVERGDVGLSRFLAYNEMDIDRPIQEGMWYFLGKKKKHAEQEIYTVPPGTDLWTVSQRFGVRMKYLLKYNTLDPHQMVASGTMLFLKYNKPEGSHIAADTVAIALNDGESFEWDVSLAPAKASGAKSQEVEQALQAEAKPDSTSGPSAQEVLHEVRPSDTLYSVARQYGVTIREIMEWNGKKDFTLAVGEKLRVVSR